MEKKKKKDFQNEGEEDFWGRERGFSHRARGRTEEKKRRRT